MSWIGCGPLLGSLGSKDPPQTKLVLWKMVRNKLPTSEQVGLDMVPLMGCVHCAENTKTITNLFQVSYGQIHVDLYQGTLFVFVQPGWG